MRLHADEVPVDDDLVRALVASQLPHLADRPLARASSTGTDNAIYRLGDDLAVRVPRIHWAVAQVDKEHEWLPRLAPHLPVAVPEPVAKGAPALGYPYPWLVSRWIDGDDAFTGVVDDWAELAGQVADFVVALHSVDTPGGPPAHGRAASFEPYDDVTRRVIAHLDGSIDGARALATWEAALAADRWNGPPVWVHGDLLPGNIVVNAGRVVGIIDWGAAAVGDPACDAILTWSLPPDARAVYRDALALDDATWARARGWAVQQAATFIPYYARTIPDAAAAARRRLDAVLEEPAQ